MNLLFFHRHCIHWMRIIRTIKRSVHRTGGCHGNLPIINVTIIGKLIKLRRCMVSGSTIHAYGCYKKSLRNTDEWVNMLIPVAYTVVFLLHSWVRFLLTIASVSIFTYVTRRELRYSLGTSELNICRGQRNISTSCKFFITVVLSTYK